MVRCGHGCAQRADRRDGPPKKCCAPLVETELAARDASNIANRLKAAGFPVTKTLESFDIGASSIPPKVFDYLSSLEWIRAQANLAIIGPAGSGKSHTLFGLHGAGTFTSATSGDFNLAIDTSAG